MLLVATPYMSYLLHLVLGVGLCVQIVDAELGIHDQAVVLAAQRLKTTLLDLKGLHDIRRSKECPKLRNIHLVSSQGMS